MVSMVIGANLVGELVLSFQISVFLRDVVRRLWRSGSSALVESRSLDGYFRLCSSMSLPSSSLRLDSRSC